MESKLLAAAFVVAMVAVMGT